MDWFLYDNGLPHESRLQTTEKKQPANLNCNPFAICLSKISNQLNPLSANPTKSSNTLKQFVGNLPTNCLSVFDHFQILALKELKQKQQSQVI